MCFFDSEWRQISNEIEVCQPFDDVLAGSSSGTLTRVDDISEVCLLEEECVVGCLSGEKKCYHSPDRHPPTTVAPGSEKATITT